MPSMSNVSLVGRKPMVVANLISQLDRRDVSMFSATTLDEVRQLLTEHSIDVVVMGAGLEVELRCGIVRATFSLSDTTSVHLKDFASGPGRMLPFVNGVLNGLNSNTPASRGKDLGQT